MRQRRSLEKCASGTLDSSNTPGRSITPFSKLNRAWPPLSLTVMSRSAPRQPGRPMPPGSGDGAERMARPCTLAWALKLAGASSAPSQRACSGRTVPSGSSCLSRLRSPAPMGRRSASAASAARSSRSAVISPPVTGWLVPAWASVSAWVWRHCRASWLGAQGWPSTRVKARPCTASLMPLALRWATKRPPSVRKASGSRPGASRTDTPCSAASRVSASGTPWSQSTQARSAAWPCCTSTGRSTWRRSWLTSARGRSAYSVPCQRCQSPARASNGPLAWARSEKRRPQSAGGVASSRKSWWRPLLRSTSSTSANCSAGAVRCSSTQRSRPPRMTISCCSNSQSAAALPSTPASDGSVARPAMSRPAMCRRPWASRRTSSLASSINSCAKRSRPASSCGTASAAETCGRCKASRPRTSRSTTSCSTKAGTQPALCTAMRPICTGWPSARLASSSMRGRIPSRRGRISQWSASQAASNSTAASTSSPAESRSSARPSRHPPQRDDIRRPPWQAGRAAQRTMMRGTWG